MSVACYPFFAEVAGHIGKLLALNGQANLSQIVRRMTETWGDRSTLLRAVQRVLRSMVQWGALREGGEKGIFISRARRIGLSERPAELVVQAVLVSHGHGMGLAQAISHPALFPFDVRLNAWTARSPPSQAALGGDPFRPAELRLLGAVPEMNIVGRHPRHLRERQPRIRAVPHQRF
jgi:hypothetical protein